MQGPVTLVTAPAGAGKTLLLALWVAAGRLPGPVVWLSLDADDNDPSRLWTDALAGLRAGGGVPPDGLLATLAPPEPGTVEAFLALLVKGLGELPHPVVVVLDDLHELTDRLTGGLADALTGGQDGARRLVSWSGPTASWSPSIRTFQTRLLDDLASLRARAREQLELAPALQATSKWSLTRSSLRLNGLLHLGTAELWSGDIDAAVDHLEQGLAEAESTTAVAGDAYLQLNCLSQLALAEVARGRLRAAAAHTARGVPAGRGRAGRVERP